jgi:hypothetical protein
VGLFELLKNCCPVFHNTADSENCQFWFFEIENKEPLILVTSKNFKEPAVLMKELAKNQWIYSRLFDSFRKYENCGFIPYLVI